MRRLYLLLFLLLLVGCTITPENTSSTPVIPTVDPADTELVGAKRKYELLCAHCHGYTGGGQPIGSGPGTVETTIELGFHPVPRHDAEGHTWQHPDQLLFQIVKDGASSPLYLYIMSPHG
ncbi:MAG: hypothetical protein KC708_25375, partial [Anaerolineae bacterium]|nr:hypothetical protein [Anaerolineae bacterium]